MADKANNTMGTALNLPRSSKKNGDDKAANINRTTNRKRNVWPVIFKNPTKKNKNGKRANRIPPKERTLRSFFIKAIIPHIIAIMAKTRTAEKSKSVVEKADTGISTDDPGLTSTTSKGVIIRKMKAIREIIPKIRDTKAKPFFTLPPIEGSVWASLISSITLFYQKPPS